MRTFLKFCFSLAVAGLLAVTLSAGAVESSKDKDKVNPIKKCQAECVGIKDNLAYENCMLKCRETYTSTNPILPTINK